jgi:uncharacterized protein YacL (UPF0231 family)
MVTNKTMTLNEAIAHAKDVAASKCDECGKEHQQLAEWLVELVVSREKITRLETELKAEHQQTIDTANELAAYKDETPITRDYLKSVCNNLKTNDYIELSFGEYDEDDFYILVQYINDVCEMWTEYDPVMQWKCPVHTVGQLRMFMSICGLDDFVKQLKA